MEISTALDGIRWAKAKGWRIFPLQINGKLPVCKWKEWDGDIEAFIRDGHNYGIDCTGLTVIDVDGWTGEETLLGIQDADGPLPATIECGTWSGGRHIIYAGASGNSVQTRLGPKLDTRSTGGYIVGPGSMIDGKPYKVLHDRPLAPLPGFIASRLAARDQRRSADDGDLDRRGALAKARTFLSDLVRRGRPVDGSGSDDEVFRAACWILGMGVSQEKCRELLKEDWCSHFDDDWLEEKVNNAETYRQNEGAVDAAPDFKQEFGSLPSVQAALLESATAPAKRSKFYPLDETEQDAQEDPEWLIRDLIQQEGLAMMIGESKSLKTFLAVDVGLSISCGVETLGSAPFVSGIVFYAAAEGARGLKRRRSAWKAARQVDAAPQFYVTAPPLIAIPEEVREFGDQLAARAAGRPIRLIVIDTMSKAMGGLNENDVKDANRLILFCESLRDAFHCAVLVLHHQSPKVKDPDGYGRGSSAFFAGFDTVIEVVRPIDPNDQSKKLPIIKVQVRKQKDAEEREDPWFLEAKAVAQSLVLQPIEAREFLALARGADPIAPTVVGGALTRLGAITPEQSVATQVLALELCPMVENEGPERHMEKVGRMAKAIRAASKGKLAGYAEGEGARLTWWALSAPEHQI